MFVSAPFYCQYDQANPYKQVRLELQIRTYTQPLDLPDPSSYPFYNFANRP